MDRLNIIHVDMDAFYASVEEQDDKSLIGKPVIVGGVSSHGVVTTANYEARKYGVHSAMPGFMAKKKCPHGIFVHGRMERYKEVSDQVFSILSKYVNKIERVSIDESYLDISNLDVEALDLIKTIKKDVLETTGLTMSVGISYNKFLAKLASDWNKPNGLKIIDRSMMPDILMPLSIGSVHGIGKKSQKKLNDIAIYTVEDLFRLSREFLEELFGKAGTEIYNRIRGIDLREVEMTRERKSIGIERTFDKETRDMKVLRSYLREYSDELEFELKRKNVTSKTIILKIKDSRFKVQTRSKTFDIPVKNSEEIYQIAIGLLGEIEIDENIRLIGITGANLLDNDLEQLKFL